MLSCAGLCLGKSCGQLCGMSTRSTLAFCLCPDSDDALLKMTISQQEFGRAGLPDLSSMTEEEQIAYAMQMSLQGAGEPGIMWQGLGRVWGEGPALSRLLLSFPQSLARQNRLTSMPAQPWTHLSQSR